MAVKSILDMSVNDDEFKEFSALFDKYSAKLGKMPGAWNAVGSVQETSADGLKTMTAAMLAQHPSVIDSAVFDRCMEREKP